MPEKNTNNLDVLLDLDGQSHIDPSGYWWKIEARCIKPSPERPHGLLYSLTLHDRYNHRVLGFDNAHAVRPTRRHAKHACNLYDHMHQPGSPVPVVYNFDSAAQLLADFFAAVDRHLDDVPEVP